MFRTYWRIHRACPWCGYVFGVQEGEFTGAMMLAQFAWGLVALYGYFYLVFYADASQTVKLAWIVVAGLLFPLVSYRHIKGLWVGIVRAGEALFDEPAN
ncbi:MAG: DUF983 domain-containing protein [Halobacteriales archaeon]|nr:DUF983 domain-containing protein [Halobacteriales archaeon]